MLESPFYVISNVDATGTERVREIHDPEAADRMFTDLRRHGWSPTIRTADGRDPYLFGDQ